MILMNASVNDTLVKVRPFRSLGDNNPFVDWHISQRYDHRDGIRQADVEKHYNGADMVNRLIQKARRDNFI